MKFGFVLSKLSVLLTFLGCEARPSETIPLWPAGAPGSEARRHEPETSGDWWVGNVHQPSIAVFEPPAPQRSGASVIVVPGGGHEKLVYQPEGVEPAKFLMKLGITAYVLKYRLSRAANSPYEIAHARADMLRALRVARSRARATGLDPKRIGVMGWSAGGELAAFASYGEAEGSGQATDPVDRLSARPDLAILIYPGQRGLPTALPKDAPPAFLLAAKDDRGPAQNIEGLARLYQTQQLPVELHLLPQGGHGFNMGQRSEYRVVREWPKLLERWLRVSGWTHAK